VGGVYFAIITQAIAAILTILIVGQQGYTGGVNGMTDLKTLHGWDIRTDSARYVLYYLCGALLFAIIFAGRFVLRSKLGKLLLAMRDKEERVRFSGYDVASFKVFVFTLAAVFSAIGGALFTLQVGFMSPSFVGIVPSIEMVVFTAVGGRASILGAIYGSLVVNYAKTFFSESFPQLWLLFMGGLFISVVMFFPNGLAGILEEHGAKVGKLWSKVMKKGVPPTPSPGAPRAPAAARPSARPLAQPEPAAIPEESST